VGGVRSRRRKKKEEGRNMSWGWDLLKDVERTFDKAIGIQEDDIGKISLASELEKVVVEKATSLRSLGSEQSLEQQPKDVEKENSSNTSALDISSDGLAGSSSVASVASLLPSFSSIPTLLSSSISKETPATPDKKSASNDSESTKSDSNGDLDLESILNSPAKESPKKSNDRARIVEDMRKLSKAKRLSTSSPKAQRSTEYRINSSDNDSSTTNNDGNNQNSTNRDGEDKSNTNNSLEEADESRNASESSIEGEIPKREEEPSASDELARRTHSSDGELAVESSMIDSRGTEEAPEEKPTSSPHPSSSSSSMHLEETPSPLKQQQQQTEQTSTGSPNNDAVLQRLTLLVQERERQLESLTRANSMIMNENQQLQRFASI